MKRWKNDEDIYRIPLAKPKHNASYDICLYSRKKTGKKANEDCVGTEYIGALQQDLLEIHSTVSGCLHAVVCDGVSSTRPFANSASNKAVNGYITEQGLQDLNHLVRETGGMTTLDGVFILKDCMHLLHIGDGSMFLIRNHKICPLTFPHDCSKRIQLMYGEKSPANLLEHCLGKEILDIPSCGTGVLKLQDQDVIYMMSDGVEKLFRPSKMKKLLKNDKLFEATKKKKRTFDDTSMIRIQVQVSDEP